MADKNNFTVCIRRDGDDLVELSSLSEEEQSKIRFNFFATLADGLMEPEGYRRVGKINEKLKV